MSSDESWLDPSSEEELSEFERLCMSVREYNGKEFESIFRQTFRSVSECFSITKAEFINKFHTEKMKADAKWYFELVIATNTGDFESENGICHLRKLEPITDGVLSLDQFVCKKYGERNPRLWSWKMIHGIQGDFLGDVKMITFKGCEFSKLDLKDVFKFATSGKFPQLKTVDLTSNCLDCPKEIGKLIKALEKRKIQLLFDPF